MAQMTVKWEKLKLSPSLLLSQIQNSEILVLSPRQNRENWKKRKRDKMFLFQ